MREKTVKRYYCDFCKKAGLSKYHMGRHESHCTLNPKRHCRMCNYVSGTNADVAELCKSLPPFPNDFIFGTDPAYVKWLAEMPAALLKLREETDNCPACIMAALRQANIPVPAVDGFDFKAESKKIFDEVNEERMQSYHY